MTLKITVIIFKLMTEQQAIELGWDYYIIDGELYFS